LALAARGIAQRQPLELAAVAGEAKEQLYAMMIFMDWSLGITTVPTLLTYHS
jgi:hypothetical protein